MVVPKNGQSMIEYAVLMVAVITVIIIFILGGPFRGTLEETLFKGVDLINLMTQNLTICKAL